MSTVARINGPALGGGVGLVFATDFRIAIDSSFIQLAEVKRGLIPAIISLYIVPQLGPSLSRAFFLTGEKVPIQRLHQAGIIYSIATSPTHLDESVSSLAALLIEGGPSAQSTIKQLIRVVSGSESEDSKVRHVKSVFEGMMKSKEAAY
ncbi:EnoyL-CoA hydratase, partial [Rhizoclosmatium hyalinum]